MKVKMSILAAAIAAYAAPALAHHSFSMFDKDKNVKITGTLKEFEWTNPHAWLHVTTVENGKPVEWSFEMGSVGQVAAQGWKADIVKPGDPLLILEAMKMETTLSAESAAKVAKVRVSEGQMVDAGVVLIQLSPAPDS